MTSAQTEEQRKVSSAESSAGWHRAEGGGTPCAAAAANVTPVTGRKTPAGLTQPCSATSTLPARQMEKPAPQSHQFTCGLAVGPVTVTVAAPTSSLGAMSTAAAPENHGTGPASHSTQTIRQTAGSMVHLIVYTCI